MKDCIKTIDKIMDEITNESKLDNKMEQIIDKEILSLDSALNILKETRKEYKYMIDSEQVLELLVIIEGARNQITSCANYYK